MIYDEKRFVNVARTPAMDAYLDTLQPVKRARVQAIADDLGSMVDKNQGDLLAAEAAFERGDIAEATRLVEGVNDRNALENILLRELSQHGVDVAVGATTGGRSQAQAAAKLMSLIDASVAMDEADVHKVLRDAYARIGPESYPEYWPGIMEECRRAGEAGLWTGDEEHIQQYVRMTVVEKVAEDALGKSGSQVPPGEIEKLREARRKFYDAHMAPTAPMDADYAKGEPDLAARVLRGCDCIDHMTSAQLSSWLVDLDAFNARVERHEYSNDRALRVLDKVKAALVGRQLNNGRIIAKIESALSRHLRGPAQIVALEQQWKAYRVTVMTLDVGDLYDDGVIRSRRAGISKAAQALKSAETYCWAPTTVEAVASVGIGMPPECALSPTALGDLGGPGVAGWWWFQEAIPIRTTDKPADVRPVVALLWGRVIQETGPAVWLTTMVETPCVLDGRTQMVAAPTVAWLWPDGVSVGDLPKFLSEEASNLKPDDTMMDEISPDVAMDAAVWFSRFYLAAATWLRQRIVTPAAATGVRQMTRSLQREHKLPKTPHVSIIELRRREQHMVAQARAAGETSPTGRSLHYRFVVGGIMGFTRNQWYPKTGTHAPKWIAPFWKGPADAPVKEGVRVYVVRR